MKTKNVCGAQHGMYLTLVALFIFVLIGFAALVVGLGFISTSKTRFQNILNLAALAAVEGYARSEAQGHSGKCNDALTRANAVVQANFIPGTSTALGALGHNCSGGGSGASGSIDFGEWVRELSAGACANPPCFVAHNDGAGPVNSVRITGHTQSSNPLITPLTRLLGKNRFQISATATASIVPRCLQLLLDASVSTVQETHYSALYRRGLSPTEFVLDQSKGPGAGRYGYFVLEVTAEPATGALSGKDVNTSALLAYLNQSTQLNRTPASLRTEHFWQDYGYGTNLYSSPFGTLLVDNYVNAPPNGTPPDYFYGAEPLSRYFLSFNVALRRLLRESAGVDRAGLIVFRGDAQSEPQIGLSTDFGYLVDLTNMMNRFNDGDPSHGISNGDNFVTKGWVPLASQGATNIVRALNQAITNLEYSAVNPNSCPQDAQRIIILASDGIMTCSEDGGNNCPEKETFGGSINQVGSFLRAQAQLISANQVSGKDSVLTRLKNNEIGLTVLLDGSHVTPNFINRRGADGKLLDLDKAWSAGYRGMENTNLVTASDRKLFAVDPVISDSLGGHSLPSGGATIKCSQAWFNAEGLGSGLHAFAYRYNTKWCGAPQPSGPPKCLTATFPRVNALWGEMAIQSGGIFCPLMNECADFSSACPGTTCYEPDPDNAACGCGDGCNPSDLGCCTNAGDAACIKRLKPSLRIEGRAQTCAIKQQSKAAQAAECAVRALGLSPFGLVEEEH